MRDPSKAASKATQLSVTAGLYLVFGIIWFLTLGPFVGGVWLALGLVCAVAGWRARDER
jgi:hypothetical protein